jgi:hypothetical protein
MILIKEVQEVHMIWKAQEIKKFAHLLFMHYDHQANIDNTR